MSDDDLSGPGPTGRFHPDTSREAGELDKAAQRRIGAMIVNDRGPEGGNAYEVWMAWAKLPDPADRRHRPTSPNNTSNRLADITPNTPAKINDPDTPRKTYYDPETGQPILWWTKKRRPTGTPSGHGHVFVAYKYAKDDPDAGTSGNDGDPERVAPSSPGAARIPVEGEVQERLW